MTKTVRQRKEELHETLKARKAGPYKHLDNPVSVPSTLYTTYKKILFDNGIKNEEVIKFQLTRMLDAQLPRNVIYSNLKFLSLIRSRMTEEGIPFSDAEKIMTVIVFNMAEIPEDDDWVGTYALEYAEILAKQYVEFFGNTVTLAQFNDGKNKELLQHFNILNVQLPSA